MLAVLLPLDGGVMWGGTRETFDALRLQGFCRERGQCCILGARIELGRGLLCGRMTCPTVSAHKASYSDGSRGVES